MQRDLQLSAKGEKSSEIAGGVYVLRNKSKRVNADNCIDTCGTGGDGKNTLNISDVKVFNPQGKIILHKSEHYHNQMEINLPDVSGLYIITLTDANGTRSKSIVLE